MSSAASSITPATSNDATSWALIRTLGGISTICGVLLALVYQGTFTIIQQNKAAALQNAVLTVVPGATQQVRFEVDDAGAIKRADGPPTGARQFFAAYDANGALVGVALEAAAQGYGDIIRGLYGYIPEKQQIVGLKILESKETPGLGDKITKSPFNENFSALDVTLDDAKAKLVNPIVFAKHGTKTQPWQIDGISGATISSKAVTRMLVESTAAMLPIVQAHLTELKEARP